jgi:peptidoglycan/LPS O-acetylase OafA/YrhL
MCTAWTAGSTPVSGRFRLGYLPALDGVRAVAVLSVMFHHTGAPILFGLWMGVEIFFVLSGFLITTLLVQEWDDTGNISLGRFYARRALRLFPALATLLAVLALVAATVVSDEQAAKLWPAILATLFYASNWTIVFDWFSLGPLGHTWSLAIEEQFYMIWPPVLVWLLARGTNRRRIMTYVAAAVVASAILRAVLWHNGASQGRVYDGLDTRADGLLIGCILGLLATSDALPRPGRALTVASTGSIVILGALALFTKTSDGYMYYGGLSVIAIATATVLAQILVGPSRLLRRVLTFAPLIWVGQLSYGFYLWHWPIFYTTYNVLDGDAATTLSRKAFIVAVEVAITLVVTSLSYYLVEQPFLRLKSRLRATGRSAQPLRERPSVAVSP